MSSQSVPLSRQASLSLIAADLKLFRDFFIGPHPDAFKSIGSFALMPFLSAFVYESANYIQREDLVEVQALRPHRELLRTSRMRMKLLDDNRKSVAQVLKDAADLAAVVSGWFMEDHRGILGGLKRLLQDDLGVFFMRDEVICATDIGFLNMGLTKAALSASSLSLRTLGPYLRDTTEDFGRYMGLLLRELQIDFQPSNSGHALSSRPIRFRDFKANRFYEAMAHELAPNRIPVCILLMSIMSQINTARIVVPSVMGHHPVALLKIKLVSLFHAVSSLQKLLNEDKNNPFLSAEAVGQIRTMLGTDLIRSVRKRRALRNDFVHYDVEDRIAAQLSPNLPLFGLIEAHIPGLTLSDLEHDIDLGLGLVSEGLRTLLPDSLTPQGTL